MKRILAALMTLTLMLCGVFAHAETAEELPAELQLAQDLGIWTKSWVRSDITIENFMTMLDKVVELLAPERLEEFQQLYPEAHDNYIGMKRTDGMAALYLTAQFLSEQYPAYMEVEFDEEFNDSIGEIWNDYGPNMQAFPAVYERDIMIVGEEGEDIEEESLLPGDQYSPNAYFYCISMKCPYDDSYLLDFSSANNSFRTADVFTLKEAAISAIRFYSIGNPEIAG